MPNSVQEFLAASTQKAAADLFAALDAIPAEKRSWKPSDKARSALDQFAECALLNGSVANTITHRAGPSAEFMEQYAGLKDSLSQDENAARALLETNTARVIAAIRAAPSEDLETEVGMPWGAMTLRAICTYPFWNMTYHQGQIVYIGSLLG
jgi:uncharacterized damage-inducible protein DinB